MSKVQAFRLKWNRFCNTRGKKGHNISLDLRLEQFNNLLKAFLKVLGSNLSQSSAQRVACCLDVLEALLESIDKDCNLQREVKQRQCKNKAESVLQIAKDLVEKEAFVKTPGRKGHNSFPKFNRNIILNLITGISSNGFKKPSKFGRKCMKINRSAKCSQAVVF